MSRISTSSAKAKGRKLQQHVRDRILDAYPDLDPDDCRSTPGGVVGEDLQLSPAARAVFPYTVECKRRAKASIWTAYQQAQRHGPHEPLLVVQADRGKPLAVISLDHLMTLLANNKNKGD